MSHVSRSSNEPPIWIQAITFAILGLITIGAAWITGAPPAAVAATVAIVYFCWASSVIATDILNRRNKG